MSFMRFSALMRILFSFFTLLIFPNLALSEGAAEFRSHGFSDDQEGRYFAFEQFGVQAGSGFPFSEIFILDLKNDTWMPETPVRVVLKDEKQPLLAARIKAFEKATPLMQQYNISRSGVLMAANPVNEVGEKSILEFRQVINPLLGKQDEPYRLELSNIDVQDQNKCGTPTGRVMGFALSLSKPNGDFVGLHDEGIAPKSRGCPERYHLIAAFAPVRYRASTFGVALVGVFSRGFEGSDLRYIATPFHF